MTPDLTTLRAVAEHAARDGGAAALKTYGGSHDEATKANIFDIVTEGDKASEAAILPILRANTRFPIFSEEGGGDEFDAPYIWHVDPIDGTVNYASNLPHFSVSIALADRDLAPVVGVVFNPVTGEMFSAARGQGATLNGKPIHASDVRDMHQALIATGFPSGRRTVRRENNLDAFMAVLPRVRDMRRLGSAALDISFVACGRLEAFWEGGMNSWDVLAALLILSESGGRYSDYDGGTARAVTGKQVVATNGWLHEELLTTINAARR
ncbi:MAG: inositol monophosphatase [Anaerolineae bacterium]|nr:inositol monophosphatase [Anaerolineae bacterium]